MTAMSAYRPLGKRDFSLSRFGAFGLLKQQRVLLARRPVRRLFFLGLSAEKHLDLEIVTNPGSEERGAVTASVRCFSITGREVSLEPAMAVQQFFADTAEMSQLQHVWIRRPKGTAFALVDLRRTRRGDHIGLNAKVKLRKRASQRDSYTSQQAFEELLASRNRLVLEEALHRARAECDHARGRALLSRLIYLWQSDIHRRELQILAAGEALSSGLTSSLSDPNYSGDPETEFLYKQPFLGKNSPDVPLTKWARCEARLLTQELECRAAGKVAFPRQPVPLEMVLAAKIAADALGITLEPYQLKDTDQRWLRGVKALNL